MKGGLVVLMTYVILIILWWLGVFSFSGCAESLIPYVNRQRPPSGFERSYPEK